MFLWCQPEQTVQQTLEWPVIWDTMLLIWRNCNDWRFRFGLNIGLIAGLTCTLLRIPKIHQWHLINVMNLLCTGVTDQMNNSHHYFYPNKHVSQFWRFLWSVQCIYNSDVFGTLTKQCIYIIIDSTEWWGNRCSIRPFWSWWKRWWWSSWSHSASWHVPYNPTHESAWSAWVSNQIELLCQHNL